MPDARLTKLAEAAAGWGAYAIPVTDVTARFRAELLMERAMTVQAADRRFAEEQAGWIEQSPRWSAHHERRSRALATAR